MRFFGPALLASVFVLGACAGGDNKAADTESTAAPAASTTPAESATPAAGAASESGAPITGTTHEVKMVFDGQKYTFEPANLTIKAGDGVKWVMKSGGPHDVAFDEAGIPAGAADKLKANMPNQQMPLQSPFLMNQDETYTVSFAGAPTGTYNYHCTPHLAMGMKGTITVQ
jgi:plastocyanin